MESVLACHDLFFTDKNEHVKVECGHVKVGVVMQRFLHALCMHCHSGPCSLQSPYCQKVIYTPVDTLLNLMQYYVCARTPLYRYICTLTLKVVMATEEGCAHTELYTPLLTVYCMYIFPHSLKFWS